MSPCCIVLLGLIFAALIVAIVIWASDPSLETPAPVVLGIVDMSTDQLLEKFQANSPSIDPLESKSDILEELELREVFEHPSLPEMHERSILSDFIQEIVFINMDHCEDRKLQVVEQIQSILEPDMLVTRFPGIRKQNGALGCALSHVHVLLHAALSRRNTLILEDDFEFNDTRAQVIDKLVSVTTLFPQQRWDVIVFGQYVKTWSFVGSDVFRLLESTTTSGYLVNKDYAETLYRAFLSHTVPLIEKPVFEHTDHIDQFQLSLQAQHMWLGFQSSIGKQRPVQSLIGNVASNNVWTASHDLQHWFTADNVLQPLTTIADFKSVRIAVCLVATGRYIQFVKNISQDMHKLFCRPHSLRLILFTDSETDFPNISRYYIPRTGFPGDTLHRYDYMLKAKDELQNFDFIFYVDVDYRILEYVTLDSLFPNADKTGVVVTRHILALQSQYSGQNYIGTPETNPASTACIQSDEQMVSYFAGGFQGGSCERFLQLCTEIAAKIAVDDANSVMAIWHDESHLNRYCVTHPPEFTLSQSFIYPEHCLDPTNLNRTCVELRNQKVRPIMIPLDKDHQKVRSV